MELKAGGLLEPGADLFAMVDTHIVTDDVDEGDGGGSLKLDMFEKGYEFFLSLTTEALATDFSCPCVEGSKEI